MKIPLNPTTAGVIARLGQENRDGSANDPIFEDRAGNRMSRYGAWRLVRRMGKKIGHDDLHPHSLRHSFVTNALEAGATLQDVQDACAHADPRTTQRYNRRRHELDNHPTYLLEEQI